MLKSNKYFSIFYLSFVNSLKNYKSLIGLSLFLITCLIIFAHLWKIAASKAGVENFSPEQLLWYIALNEWILISIPDIHDDMEQDLRSGRLAYLLPRPISYLGSICAEAFGTLSVNLIVLGFVTYLFTWLQVGALPFPLYGLPLTVALGFMAGFLGIIFQMLIGLTAFWLHEVSPIYWIWEKLLFILGGLILPLSIYPQWMQTIAYLTPFSVILGERSALALDFNLTYVFKLIAIMLGWTVIGVAALIYFYRRGLRILNVEGG